MRGFVRILIASLITSLKLLILALLSALALTLRYLWSTPQPLRSDIAGEPRIYKWTHGTIFYKVAGPTDAPPLVLLHAPAIGASSHEMRHLIERLVQHYHVYVPDLLGFGLSDRPHLDYTAELYVQLCQDFVANVIAQPVLLLGSGLSCNYSVAVAARRPDLCQGIILLSPRTLFTGPRLPQWLVQLLLYPPTTLPFYSLFTTHAILRMIVPWQHAINSTITGTQVSSEELAAIFANAHQFGAEHAALAWLAGKLDLEILPQLEQLAQPILTLWDRHALTSIPATGHVLLGDNHEEWPAQIVAHILAWQSSQETATITTSSQQNASTDHEVSSETIIPAVRVENHAEMETLPETIYAAQSPDLSGETDEEVENVVIAETIEAYCVRCRQKRIMQHPHKIVTKNGRSALEGTCSVCNARLFRFIKG